MMKMRRYTPERSRDLQHHPQSLSAATSQVSVRVQELFEHMFSQALAPGLVQSTKAPEKMRAHEGE